MLSKKRSPPVETGRPLRLLDMRLFNILSSADLAYEKSY